VIVTFVLVLFVASGCKRSAAPVAGSVRLPPGLLASHQAREKGRDLFLKNCAICHGTNGDGNGARSVGMTPPPANLTIPPWSESSAAPRIFSAIRDGVAGSAMPRWTSLDNEQVRDLVAYVHSLGDSGEPGAAHESAR
jgi:mono/diheme cytochrome c family protein